MERKKPITLAEICLAIYYAWYFTPALRTYFTGTFKYFFFAFFAAGLLLLIITFFLATGGVIESRFGILLPIICYMVLMTLMVMFNYCDASSHIRVSFTFWGTAFVYYLMGYDTDVKVRFGKFLICLFVITSITSVIGIYTYEGAARALTNASQTADALDTDYTLGMRNISSIYLFQMMVVITPVLINMIIKKEKVIVAILIVAFIFASVLKAAFTISLILLIMAVILSFVYAKKPYRMLLIVGLILIALMFPWGTILQQLATLIGDNYISPRLNELADLFNLGTVSGDISLRSDAYTYSFQTFLKNPFCGIGAYYSYNVGENGIGYHSQILDDMARFGIWAVLFYALFFWNYFKLLRDEWRKIDMEDVALSIVVIFFSFVLLNIAFRSADESIVVLYILPVLPDIISRSSNYTDYEVYEEEVE